MIKTFGKGARIKNLRAPAIIVVIIAFLSACPSPFGYYDPTDVSEFDGIDSVTATAVSTPLVEIRPDVDGGPDFVAFDGPQADRNVAHLVRFVPPIDDARVYVVQFNAGEDPPVLQPTDANLFTGDPIRVASGDVVFRFVATKRLHYPSSVREFRLTVDPSAASSPDLQPPPGVFESDVVLTVDNVTVIDGIAVPDVDVLWTWSAAIDDDPVEPGDPTVEGELFPTEGFALTGSADGVARYHVRAFARYADLLDSPVVDGVYSIVWPMADAPVLSAPPGVHDGPIEIAMASGTPGASIRYTLDGTPPSEHSLVYAGPIAITRTTTVSAAAFADGRRTSDVVTATYTIPPIYFVDAAAVGAADGSSWPDAFPTLADALDTAESGSQVWVAMGMYVPPPVDQTESLTVPPGVSVYGGFVGGELELSMRHADPATNGTILSGVSGLGWSHFTVVRLGAGARLDGVTVSGGAATGTGAGSSGGGVVIDGAADVVVANTRISANHAAEFGGGSAVISGSVTFENVVFEGNSAGIGGGAVHADGSTVWIEDTQFYSNQASQRGGAIHGRAADLYVVGGAFLNNYAPDRGGAIDMQVDGTNGTSVTVTGNTDFSQNTTEVSPAGPINPTGGAINVGYYGYLEIDGASFNANYSWNGGAIGSEWAPAGATISVRNATFSDNAVLRAGGAIFANGNVATTVQDSTFTGNTAAADGGAIHAAASASAVEIHGSVFSANESTAGSGGAVAAGDYTALTVSTSTFTLNTASSNGGALFANMNTPVLVVSSVFDENHAGANGGAVRFDYDADFVNATFVANTAGSEWGGHAINAGSGFAAIYNTIIRGQGDSAIAGGGLGAYWIRNSNIEGSGGSAGWVWGDDFASDAGGNIDVDPAFVNAQAGNLRLTAGSPSRNAGTNTPYTDPESPALGYDHDRDGNWRINGTVDMGAYEFYE